MLIKNRKMNYFNIFSIFISSILCGCSLKYSSSFLAISKQINEKAFEGGITNSKNDYYRKVRRLLNRKVPLDKLLESNHIFMLESFQYENGVTYGLIWSQSDTISYAHFKGIIEINTPKTTYFENDLMALISRWDVRNIKNRNPAYPEQLVYGSKIDKSNELKIEVIEFLLF